MVRIYWLRKFIKWLLRIKVATITLKTDVNLQCGEKSLIFSCTALKIYICIWSNDDKALANSSLNEFLNKGQRCRVLTEHEQISSLTKKHFICGIKLLKNYLQEKNLGLRNTPRPSAIKFNVRYLQTMNENSLVKNSLLKTLFLNPQSYENGIY